MARHIIHLAMTTRGKPVDKMRFLARKFGVGDSHRLETQFASPCANRIGERVPVVRVGGGARHACRLCIHRPPLTLTLSPLRGAREWSSMTLRIACARLPAVKRRELRSLSRMRERVGVRARRKWRGEP